MIKNLVFHTLIFAQAERHVLTVLRRFRHRVARREWQYGFGHDAGEPLVEAGAGLVEGVLDGKAIRFPRTA